MRFVHIMIRVKDIEKSMRFYTELLDMNKTGEVELDDCTLYYLSDEDGQTQIEMTYNKETPANGYERISVFVTVCRITKTEMRSDIWLLNLIK